jgi:hypothetical protein
MPIDADTFGQPIAFASIKGCDCREGAIEVRPMLGGPGQWSVLTGVGVR